MDRVRYYLLSELPQLNDGSITYETMISRCNTDLANIYGNLVSRTASMISKYFDGVIPVPDTATDKDEGLYAAALQCKELYTQKMDEYKISEAVSAVITFLKACNKYIDDTAPWVLAKNPDDKGKLATVLANLVEGIRVADVLLYPYIPDSSDKVAAVYGFEGEGREYDSVGKFSYYATGKTVNPDGVLFARIDEKEFFEKLAAERAAEEAKKQPVKAEKKEEVAQIGIEDFSKVQLVACKVLECEAVPKSDKLLRLIVDDGEGKRQVVSGIAKFYKPDELIGKTLVLVANLTPAKLRGVESCGMILASGGETVKLVELDDSVAPGTRIS